MSNFVRRLRSRLAVRTRRRKTRRAKSCQNIRMPAQYPSSQKVVEMRSLDFGGRWRVELVAAPGRFGGLFSFGGHGSPSEHVPCVCWLDLPFVGGDFG